MKSVASHPFFRVAPRQRESLRHRRLGAVKCGIEACNLGNRRRHLSHCVDDRHIVRLVQRSERVKSFQLGQRFQVDDDGRMELCSAVDDAMTHRDDAVSA